MSRFSLSATVLLVPASLISYSGKLPVERDVKSKLKALKDCYWTYSKSRRGLRVLTAASEMPDSVMDKVHPKYSIRTNTSASEKSSISVFEK
jgi:hypothetical protein